MKSPTRASRKHETPAEGESGQRGSSQRARKYLCGCCQGCHSYNLKLIEIARTNTCAAFEFANELLGVKSPSEFIELSTAQMHKQFQVASAQNKELCALAQEVATELQSQSRQACPKHLIRPPDWRAR